MFVVGEGKLGSPHPLSQFLSVTWSSIISATRGIEKFEMSGWDGDTDMGMGGSMHLGIAMVSF